MRGNSHQRAFFELVKAGLWDKELQLVADKDINWQKVYRLAQEQSVLGIFLAGLEKTAIKPPQALLLQCIGEVQMLELQNKAMNSFIETLIGELRKADVYALLVKGQGIAQSYEKPLWRACGDVDLLLSDNNYRKANAILSQNASTVDEENPDNKHIAMIIDGWSVELHGTLRSGLWKGIDLELDKVQNSVFCEGKVRSWMNGNTQVFLPAPDEDVVFVFSHILQHFYKEGIGFRQICDWCRLLWTYKDSLNQQLLESRIRKMGVMTEWKVFAALTVNYLGMPAEAMPFYSPKGRWSSKADKVMQFVLETGNFGHNRDYSYLRKYPYVVYKAISARKHIEDFGRYFDIFPLDAVKVTWNRMCLGVSEFIKGKKHESIGIKNKIDLA